MTPPDLATATGHQPQPTLTGQKIFVAGATGSIGQAVSQTLACYGADLVLHSRTSSPTAERLASELRRHGVQIEAMHGDVTDPRQMRGIREQLAGQPDAGLDALINCTGGFDGRPVDVADLTVTEFRRVVDVDLVGSFVLAMELLPLLARQNKARIILFSSLAGLRGRPKAAHLCAAKAGIQGLALGLARDLASYGIVVHVVAPGPVGRHVGPTGVPASSPAEVADVVAFLASARGDLLRSQALVLQGLAEGTG